MSVSVHQAFSEITSDVLTRVHKQWKTVLHLILSGKGTNEVVEKHRGKLNRSLLEAKDLPTIPKKLVDGYYSMSEEDEDEEESGDKATINNKDVAECLYNKC